MSKIREDINAIYKDKNPAKLADVDELCDIFGEACLLGLIKDKVNRLMGLSVPTHTHTCMQKHNRIHALRHSFTQALTHARTHTRTHTCIHMQVPPEFRHQ